MNNTPPTTEERIWAVLAHLSSLAFGMGVLLPIIGWSEQRRKSKYASFHCLQALGYQSLGYTVWILSVAVILVLAVLILAIVFALTAENSNASPIMSAVFGMGLGFFFLIIFSAYFLLPLIAAISCGLGKDFHYPIMGKQLAKYLGYRQPEAETDWLIEDHEDRWVAAMGHSSVIIYLWGLLAPITAWILRGRQSVFMKFQSVQTVVYQGLATMLYLAGGMIYLFGFIIFIGLTGFEGNSRGSVSSTSMLGLVFLIVTMIVAMLIILIMPLLHIMGQWAGYRVLKGDDYHYPLIGRWVERWLSDRMVQAPDSTAVVLEEKRS